MTGRPARPSQRGRAGLSTPRDGEAAPGARAMVGDLIRALRRSDQAAIEAAITGIAQSHRILAPLAFLLGALTMVAEGLRLLLSNWRLLLIEIVPAMWVWAAMLDLKLHLVRGHTFASWHGAPAAALMLGVTIVTIASYYLNVVFAFAVSSPDSPQLRPAFTRARAHSAKVVLLGSVVGMALAVAVVIAPRWGLGWFSLALSLVLAVLMITYVAFPARLLGITSYASKRDKVAATAVSGAVGAAVSTPAYLTGRLGVLLLGSRHLFVIGAILISIGFPLQAGANGAISAIKMSVKLVVTGDTPPARSERG